jgi:hypothetical protein
MKMSELRNTTLQYFQKQMPNVPDYVVRDLVYKGYKNDPDDAGEIIQWLNSKQWQLRLLTVTPNIWNDDTTQKLKSRAGGKSPGFKIPDDAARHEQQKSMLASGPSKEPIIVSMVLGRFELIEGWHRTIQSMELWPEGYKQAAWIGF